MSQHIDLIYKKILQDQRVMPVYKKIIQHSTTKPTLDLQKDLELILSPYQKQLDPKSYKRIHRRLYIMLLKRLWLHTHQPSFMQQNAQIEEKLGNEQNQTSTGFSAIQENGSSSIEQRSSSTTASDLEASELTYQTIIYPEGYFLVDKNTGKAWFMAAGTQKYIPCTPPQEAYQAEKDEEFKRELSQFASQELRLYSDTFIPATSYRQASSELDLHNLSSRSPLPTSLYRPIHQRSHIGDQEIIEQYPYPIAFLYQAFLQEEKPVKKIKTMMNLFETLLKYMCIPLVIQYLNGKKSNAFSTQFLQRLQSAQPKGWLEFLSSISKQFSQAPSPYTVEAIESYFRLEERRPLHQRFVYVQSYIDSQGQEQEAEMQLGLLEAMLLYRESYGHVFNPTTQKAEEELETYSPVMNEILYELSWMKKYKLFYTEQKTNTLYSGHPLSGLHPPQVKSHSFQFKNPPPSKVLLFLQDPHSEQKPLCLYPLLIAAPPLAEDAPPPGHKHSLFFFHKHTGNELVYKNIQQSSLRLTEGVAYWQQLLEENLFAMTKPNKPIKLLKHSIRWSKYILAKLIQNQQYLPETTVARERAEKHISDFLISNKSIFLLKGSIGTGKTTLFAKLTQSLLHTQKPTLLLRGIDLRSSHLQKIITKILGFPPTNSWRDLLDQVIALLTPSNPLILFIDGLEEHPVPSQIANEIKELLLELEKKKATHKVKILISYGSLFSSKILSQVIRKHAQKNDSTDLHEEIGSPFSSYELSVFQKNELQQAYQKTRSFQNSRGLFPFCPQTSFQELKELEQSYRLLHHPLCLRYALTTYNERKIPQQLTIEKVFSDFTTEVIEEASAPLPVPQRLQFLKHLLIHQEKVGPLPLSRQELKQLEDPIFLKELENPFADSAFLQLQHIGALREEWNTKNSLIHFNSELLHSYILTEQFQKEQEDQKAQAEIEHEPQTANFFRWIRKIRKKEVQELLQIFTSTLEAKPDLVREFLLFLLRINDPGVEELLQEIFLSKEVALQKVAKSLFSQINASNELLLLSEPLQQALVTNSHSQKDCSSLLKEGILHQKQRHLQQAHRSFVQCYHLAREAQDFLTLAKAVLQLSKLKKNSELLHTAVETLNTALPQKDPKEKRIYQQLLARLLRQQGNQAYRQNHSKQALHCFQQSQKLEEGLNNPKGLSTSLSNIATVFGAVGELEKALEHYQMCLKLQKDLGDRKQLAKTLNNIGIILQNQGAQEQALSYLQRSLAIRQELGRSKDLAKTHKNIAFLLKQEGDISGSLAHLTQSMLLHDKETQTKALALIHEQIAEIHLLQGSILKAESHLNQASIIYMQTDAPKSYLLHKLSGKMYEQMNSHELALLSLKAAEQKIPLDVYEIELCSIKSTVARCYSAQNNKEKALQELNKICDPAKGFKSEEVQLLCQIELADFHLSNGDYQQAEKHVLQAAKRSKAFGSLLLYKDTCGLQIQQLIQAQSKTDLTALIHEFVTILRKLPFDMKICISVRTLISIVQRTNELKATEAYELCGLCLEKLGGRKGEVKRRLLSLKEELADRIKEELKRSENE